MNTETTLDRAINVKAAPRERGSRFQNVGPGANALLNVFFILYSLACLFPILLVVSASLSDETSIALHGYKLFPEHLTFDAYRFLFRDPHQIVQGYLVSIAVTILGSAAGLLLTASFAFPLARRDFSLRSFFSFYIFFTMIFNGGLVPWYLVYTQAVNLHDSLLGLIVPNLLLNAFNVIMMRTFFQTTIHPSIIESASIDGAGELRIFFRIVLPLSLPVLATVGLFYTLSYWNDWFNSLVFIDKDNLVNLQFLMYKVMKNLQYLNSVAASSGGLSGNEIAKLPSESARMAMCIVGIGPIVLAYPFFQKYFIQGLTVGAVKG